MPSMTQSIEKLQKRLDKDPNSLMFVQLAEEHRKEGNLEEALRVLKAGVGRHPNYWSARVTMGKVHHLMGNDASAREELEKVVSAVPDHLLANRMLGDIYTRMQLPDQALQRYRIVQMITPADEALEEQIRNLEAQVAPAPQSIRNEVQPEPVLIPEVQTVTAPETLKLTPAQNQHLDAAEPEREVYAPTIQIQVPDSLEKTEVPVTSIEVEASEARSETEAAEEAMRGIEEELEVAEDAHQITADENPASPIENVSTAEPRLPDTLILTPAREELEPEVDWTEEEFMEEDLARPSDSEELSSLANLLLSAEESVISEPQRFDELDSEFAREPESHEKKTTRSMDRTQPIEEENAELDQADELTTETLAELYLNQGLTEKATKVYQRMLLNDPGNERILRKLQQITAEQGTFEPKIDLEFEEAEELVEDPPEQLAAAPDEEDFVNRRAEERRRKIHKLENWLSTIRRERD